jgi:ABC-type antimicrobial peptide transport system permease subunit
VKQNELAEVAAHGAAYFPNTDSGYFSLLVRSRLQNAVLVPMVQKTVLQLDPELPIDDLKPLQVRIDESLIARRSPAILAGIFATVALLLAAIGTYGVLAYAVSQRRREIGVRMALGALPKQVLAQFLGLGSQLLAIGLALGVLGAWAAGRAMQSVLFNVGALNLDVLAASAGVMLGVVFFAMFLPSLRAARVNPLDALRAE